MDIPRPRETPIPPQETSSVVQPFDDDDVEIPRLRFINTNRNSRGDPLDEPHPHLLNFGLASRSRKCPGTSQSFLQPQPDIIINSE